jgi:hypothetical protein
MMNKPLKHCVILTMDCLDAFEVYDTLLDEPLLARGWKTHTLSWKNKEVDWNDYDAVIIRSPWDYQDYADEFVEVLNKIDQSTAHLENNLATVKWNIDKIYLESLEAANINIVSTLWQNNISETLVAHFFDQLSTNQLVIKPRISANADDTYWLTRDNYIDFYPQLLSAFSESSFMVQPFMESVIKEGEFSLFYFNGVLSHTILKTPKNDDFRVQEEHGGRLTTVEPEQELINQANKTMNAIADQNQMPLYARIDFVRDKNSFALMEAELIEPSLYFNMDAESPNRFADAFVDRMQHITL